MNQEISWRNFGLDLVRVTETAALAAGRWVGSGNYQSAHRAASLAMAAALDTLDIDGHIVIGEDDYKGNGSSLRSLKQVGTGDGPEVDVVVDPIDGTKLLINGRPGAIAVIGVAPRGSMWSPVPAHYMDKIVVDREAAHALVPQCMNAPAAWTLALIARVKKKSDDDIRRSAFAGHRLPDAIPRGKRGSRSHSRTVADVAVRDLLGEASWPGSPSICRWRSAGPGNDTPANCFRVAAVFRQGGPGFWPGVVLTLRV
jgi:fructose-1,6-bisphosphatase/sedoheptulose 1,7-bisphosphatase-like protein